MDNEKKVKLINLLKQYKKIQLNQASLKAPAPIKSKSNVTISDLIDIHVSFKYIGDDLEVKFSFPKDANLNKDTFKNGYMLNILETAQQFFTDRYDCDVQAIDLITFYDVVDQKQLNDIQKGMTTFLNKIKNLKPMRNFE